MKEVCNTSIQGFGTTTLPVTDRVCLLGGGGAVYVVGCPSCRPFQLEGNKDNKPPGWQTLPTLTFVP
jgi:hypothetical protein